MYSFVSRVAFTLNNSSAGTYLKVKNEEHRPKNCGIIVANHTTPYDLSVMSAKFVSSLVRKLFFTIFLYFFLFFFLLNFKVGQSQGGLFGIFQFGINRSIHLFFERSESKDRLFVMET